MVSYPVMRAATTAIVAVVFGLGCGSGGGTGGSTGTSGGDSSGATAVKGGQTSTGKTGAPGNGGNTSQSSDGNATKGGTKASLSNSATKAGGTTGPGGNGSGGKSASVDSGGEQSLGGQASTDEVGGTSSGGSAKGGTSGKSGASSSGGSQARGGSGTGVGGTKPAGGTSTSGGAQPSGGTTSSGGTENGNTTSTKPPTYGGGGATSLCGKYADYFPIGAAVDNQSYNTHASVLTKHFNSITMENEMKFDQLQPTEGNFTYGTADNIAAFATKNGMKIRGHALVWHRQTPSWVFSPATRDAVLAKMKSHITAVMTHFKGKVYAWDVVNEAIMDNGAYRTGDEASADQSSQWYKVVGVDYIAEAFKYAYAVDPTVKLFYNDYYNYVPARRQAIYNMLKGLLEKGVPVHGVGLQAHLNIEPSTVTTNQAYYQTVAELEEAIKLYSSLNLDVQITEMDLSLYIPGVTYNSSTFYTAATFTDVVQAKQAERYRDFFNLFRKYKDVITGVTLWGVADDNTWLSEFSSGRKDFPLLFDNNHQPKKAYYAVVDF